MACVESFKLEVSTLNKLTPHQMMKRLHHDKQL